jgi:hypothetical protein
MVTLHAFVTLLAGCATIVLLDAGMAGLTSRLIPGWAAMQGGVSAGYAVVRVGWAFLAGAAGGYVTACLATGRVPGFVLVLAVIALLLGGLNALAARGKLPVAWRLANAAVTPMGVVAGGLVWLRMRGIY